MLKEIIKNKSLTARGIVGIYPANSVGDDIQVSCHSSSTFLPVQVYGDESRSEVLATFYGLRQQAEKESESTEPYYCLSDFVAPKDTGIPDYIGFFAVSAGFGCDELAERYQKENDDYNVILVKSLADRLVRRACS